MTYQSIDGPGRAGTEFREKIAGWDIPVAEQLIYASRLSGKSLLATALEFRRLSRGRGRLTMDEYVDFSVMTAPDNEKDRFISAKRHWPIVEQVCDMNYRGITEDKWIATQLMQAAGIPVPTIVAVVDSSDRNFLDTCKVSTPEEFRAVLRSTKPPLFGKTNHGLGSFGAFVITNHDENGVTIHTGETLSIEHLFSDWFVDDTYLLQNCLSNHSEIERLSDHLVTVRIGILKDGDTVKIPACCAKIPAANNVADNFWRPGNLIAALDPKTGRIQRIRTRRKGRVVDASEDELPVPIDEIRFPFWDQQIDLAGECARLFHSAKYASLDIACTPDGPVVVEANTGGGWDLFQFASAKGFLTDDVLGFFRKSGVDI